MDAIKYMEHVGPEFLEIRDFYLHEAFGYAHEAAVYALASQIHSAQLEEYKPEGWAPEWDDELNEFKDDEVLDHLGEIWNAALMFANRYSASMPGDTELISQDIAGHVVFLSAYVEATLNFELETMRREGKLSSSTLDNIDRTDIVAKALLIFGSQQDVSGLTKLVTLRNKAIHYRASHYGKISIGLADLVKLWKQIAFIDAGKVALQENTVSSLAKAFAALWKDGPRYDKLTIKNLSLSIADEYVLQLQHQMVETIAFLKGLGLTDDELTKQLADLGKVTVAREVAGSKIYAYKNSKKS